MDADKALFEFLLRMGDNTLILGHRVSQWCGHAPVLEEDMALANVALDMIGQTQLWLGLAGSIEGGGRTADVLAFRRDAWDFRNLLLVERPNGHFGQTIMRQFLFDSWHHIMLGWLAQSTNTEVAEIAEKTGKEVAYLLERSSDLVIRLGDGTSESQDKMQAALDDLWPYIGEMFVSDGVDSTLSQEGVVPLAETLRPEWDVLTGRVLRLATLGIPETGFVQKGGKTGTHTEHLGHILSDMQFLQRAYPDATW